MQDACANFTNITKLFVGTPPGEHAQGALGLAHAHQLHGGGQGGPGAGAGGHAGLLDRRAPRPARLHERGDPRRGPPRLRGDGSEPDRGRLPARKRRLARGSGTCRLQI